MQPVSLHGTVTRFKGNGRKLGYPTANLTVDTNLKDGVYFGFSDLLDWKYHPTVIFIGTPTTVGDTERRVEAYLLDIPDKDYYDNELKLYVDKFHRPNQTFASIEKLLEVMKEDETAARDWFSSGSDRA